MNHPLKSWRLGAALLIAGSTTVIAQDQEPVTPESPSDKAKLIEVLGKLEGSEGMSMNGSIRHSTPKEAGGDAAVGGMQAMVLGANVETENHFEGGLEFQLQEKGKVAARSTSKGMPRFRYFSNGKREVTSMFFEGDPVVISRAIDELTQLSDIGRIVRAVEASDEVRSSVRDGNRVYEAVLPASFLQEQEPEDAAIAALGGGSTERVDAEFLVDANGRIAEVTYKVVRANPMADLLGNLGGAEVVVGGGSGAESLDDLPDDVREMVEEALGGLGGDSEDTTTYRMKIGRASKELQEAQQVLMAELAF